ncbi:TPA_asm: polyprotein [Anacyclus depressus waikavirus]|uniref:Genome polyprotein n=1 Tax=Anacyclus depressus waikavirus TaxID=3027335 RepID=A0AA48SGG2_9SECO|nr:TPA_asm: polyprotein [Anacyclus depressus waikavirus]
MSIPWYFRALWFLINCEASFHTRSLDWVVVTLIYWVYHVKLAWFLTTSLIKMQNTNTNNHRTSSLSSVNKSLLRLKVAAGVVFETDFRCLHSKALSSSALCGCFYCNFISRINKFYIKNKVIVSRPELNVLTGYSFRRLFSNSCLLFCDSARSGAPSIEYAKALADNWLGCEYDCPVSGMHGINTEKCYNHDSWGFCNNAQHLFECFSTSDQKRGDFFPVYGEGSFWHTTCTSCAASCAFASPREGMILAEFMSFLNVGYTGLIYYVCLRGDDERVQCSKAFANLIVLMQGGCVEWNQVEVYHVDPEVSSAECNVILSTQTADGQMFGFNVIKRYAKDDDVLGKECCNHTFILKNTADGGVSISLSPKMMRVLMMLMPCHGYMTGIQYDELGNKHKVENMCGLYSIGGMIGVNIRCNEEFKRLHQRFYEGGFRVPNPPLQPPGEEDFTLADNGSTDDDDFPFSLSFHDGDLNCVQQSSTGTEYEDEIEEVDEDDETSLLLARAREFKNNDEPLLVIETSRTSTRGLVDLSKRVGGLLKGATNCVSKLHAVWDWPLDTIIKQVRDLGDYMSQYKDSVSDTVWSCQMCTEVRSELEAAIQKQTVAMEVLRESVKKLSAALDGVTGMNQTNLKLLEAKILEVEKIKGGLSSGSGITTAKELELLRSLNDLTEAYQSLKSDVEALSQLVSRGKERPIPRRESNSTVGEQMAVPRRVKKKDKSVSRNDDFPFEFREGPRTSIVTARAQMADPVEEQVPEPTQSEIVTFEGGESSAKSVSTSVVKVGRGDLSHNALLTDIYLGSVKWSVSSGEGKVLKSFSLPEAIWENNPFLKNFAQFFQYYTCSGFTIKITTTSVPMQGGTLLVCWDAMDCAGRQKINTVLQLSNLPFALIHASTSEKLEFTVDSPSIQSTMCLSGSEHSLSKLGTFYICIANVLNAAAETSQSVDLNVWVKFNNPEFSFRTVAHEIVQAQSGSSIDGLGGIESLEAIIAEGKWSNTSSTNLMELTVHPTAVDIKDGLVTQTVLSVISHMYSRWSGSLIYKFVFGASAFVRGKLLVSVVPIAFRNTKITIDQMSTFPSIVCDLSLQTREFSITAPYCSIGENSLVCRDSLYDVSAYDAQLVTSRIHVVVLDALVMNANASNSISFFVTVRPGPDFSLFDVSGIKAEFVERTIKQSFGPGLCSSALIGRGYSSWVSLSSVLHNFRLDSARLNALCMMVSPVYRNNPPCITLLSWLASIFVEWSGSLTYTLRAHSYDRSSACVIRVWYDCNGSTQSGDEFEFLSDVAPPAGKHVVYWDPFENDTMRITVPFMARTKKLLLHKARYEPSDNDWLWYYNGMLVIDYEGRKDIGLELSIAGGSDFQMFEQTVAPRCGKVTKSFTQLSYHDKMKGVTSFPSNTGRLSGPINKAIVTPVKFVPSEGVDKGKESPGSSVPPTSARRVKKNNGPKEGDTDVDVEGRPIIFRNGDWEFISDDEDDAIAQGPAKCIPHPEENERAIDEDGDPIIFRNGAWECYEEENSDTGEADAEVGGCFGSCAGLGDAADLVKEINETGAVRRALDVAEGLQETAEVAGKTLPALCESMKFLLPLLNKAEKFSGCVEEKLAQFGSLKSKIMRVIKNMLSSSIPGVVKSACEKDEYVWATMLTIIGGSALIWFCKSKKSFLKKLSILCMIVWAPYIGDKIFQLGAWIKKKFKDMFSTTQTTDKCRAHSNCGPFEFAKESFGNFSDWFSSNWMEASQRILTVLGVVASLVVWGTIPDGKKLSSFSERFKEVGNKGRSFSNIFSGFNSITKMCGEWSKTFVSWIAGSNEDALPKADCVLQKYVDFDIREWVTNVREMSLQEKKFVGFGTPEYISKVRRLYDASQKIQGVAMSGVQFGFQLNAIIKDCTEKSRELLDLTYSLKGMKQTRIDPIHICMIGAPGVGKSAVSHVIINNLLDHRGEPEIDRIYTRCCADQYWSNYHQEPVILYDDLGAITTKLKLSDYAEIMGVKTNDPFSIPMAIAEEKGKHCTSRYIFSCTNVLELDDSGDVVTKAAYYRRRNVLLRVERDPDVEKSEANPTAGLLFTVLGHSAENVDGTRFFFGVKTRWDEPFLKDVDTSDWVFEKVNFKTFLKFLCVYTDAYMKSQEKLLAGIHHYRVDPFEDEVVTEDDNAEAQVGPETEKVITLGELMSAFDKRAVEPRIIYNMMHSKGVIPPDQWKTSKPMKCREYIDSLCGCGVERSCCYRYNLRNMQRCLSDVPGDPVFKKFVLKSVNKNPEDTLLKVVNSDLFSNIHPASVLHTIASYYRMALPEDVCPFALHHQFAKDRSPLFGEEVELDFEDRISPKLDFFLVGKDPVYLWPSVAKLFPRSIEKYGYIAVWTGKAFVYISDKKQVGLRLESVQAVWRDIWIEGPQCNVNLLDLFPADDRTLIKGLVKEVSDFGEQMSFSEPFLKAIENFSSIYSKPETFAFILHCVAIRFERSKKLSQALEKESKKKRLLKSTEMLNKIEEDMTCSLSRKMKIALSIAGGIAASGLLVGVFFGLKALFSGVSSLLGGNDKKEEVSAETSSGGASGNFTTARVIKTRSPQIKIVNVASETSSGGASGNFQTPRVIKARRPVQLKSQEGFGTAYDDKDTLPAHLKKERRKKNRDKFKRAIIAQAKGKVDNDNSLVKGNLDWQKYVEKREVNKPTGNYKSEVLQRIARDVVAAASNKTVGECIAEVGEEKFETAVTEQLMELQKISSAELKELVKCGTVNEATKQVQVGSFGVVKDINLIKLVDTHIAGMSCCIIGFSGDGPGKVFGCMRIKSTFIIIPAHYIDSFEEKDDLYFVCPNKVTKIKCEGYRMCSFPGYQDVILWDLGPTVPPARNYMPFFYKESDWKNYTTRSGLMVQAKYLAKNVTIFANVLEKIELVNVDTEVPTGMYSMLDSTHTIIEGLRYRVNSMPGSCGSPILISNTKNDRKIGGMHVAGHEASCIGYAEIITQEKLQVCIDELDKLRIVGNDTIDTPDIDYATAQKRDIEDKGNLGIVGVVHSSLVPNIPSKTSIVKSHIHGMIGKVASEPAILSKWDHRLGNLRSKWDPVIEGVKKYGTEITPFSTFAISLVERHMVWLFQGANNSRYSRKVNNVDVGINGIQETDFWAPMEMKTSPGYPYVLRKPKNATGKSWLFKEVGTYPSGRTQWALGDEEFIKSFNTMHDDIKRGVTLKYLTMECPKDERRKLSKIYDTPATRTFTILPPEVNLLFRMYFGDFAAMVMETRANHFCQVGINCETLEWSDLMNNMKQKGSRGFAGDYGKFDGIGSPEIYHSIVSFINKWYDDGEENARARHALINSIVHRHGLVNDLIIRYSQGMPSGFSMTVIFNSFVNYYYMSLAWMHIIARSPLSPQADLGSFAYYAKIIVYGDDNVVAVNKAFLPYYNLRTVASYLSQYGITYTDDAKNPIHMSEPDVDISTVTFLKRSFVNFGGSALWKAPLNKVSIEERCNWIRDCEIPEEALFQNIDSALYEAHIHGEEYFNDLKLRLNKALERVGLPLVYHTFSQNLSRWWANMTDFNLDPVNLSQLVELSKFNDIDMNKKYHDLRLGQDVKLSDILEYARTAPSAVFVP